MIIKRSNLGTIFMIRENGFVEVSGALIIFHQLFHLILMQYLISGVPMVEIFSTFLHDISAMA